MGNKINDIHEINFLNPFHTPRDQETRKIRQNPEKWDCDFFR